MIKVVNIGAVGAGVDPHRNRRKAAEISGNGMDRRPEATKVNNSNRAAKGSASWSTRERRRRRAASGRFRCRRQGTTKGRTARGSRRAVGGNEKRKKAQYYIFTRFILTNFSRNCEAISRIWRKFLKFWENFSGIFRKFSCSSSIYSLKAKKRK